MGSSSGARSTDERQEGPIDSLEGAQRLPEPELRGRLAASRVAIIGCGGLGSNVAAMLVRCGVKNLTLVDSDRVEESNLNRQLFFRDQIGMLKTEALAVTLRRIEPDLELDMAPIRVTEDDLVDVVRGADVVIEAVDQPDVKAMIIGVVTRDLPEVPLVAASGLAGYDEANSVRTQHLAENVWVVGDMTSDVREGHALLASRVMVAAAHEAHAAIRLLLGCDPD